MYYDLLDLYKQKKYKEFLVLFHEYIKDRKNGIDEVLMFEYAKVLIKNHKDDEASNVLRLIIKLNSNSQYAHLELGKLYSSQGRIEEAKLAYNKIYDMVYKKYQDAEAQLLHIKKHNKDNLYKSKHSVFNVDIMDVINYFYENDFESVPGSGCDIYNIYYKNAGYEGGYDGDGHIQDYVTILTTPGNKEEIITMYPSDKRVIEEDFKKKTIK